MQCLLKAGFLLGGCCLPHATGDATGPAGFFFLYKITLTFCDNGALTTWSFPKISSFFNYHIWNWFQHVCSPNTSKVVSVATKIPKQKFLETSKLMLTQVCTIFPRYLPPLPPLLSQCLWSSSSSKSLKGHSVDKSACCFSEHLSSVPSTHINQLTITYNSRSRGSYTIFWLSHGSYIHTHTHTRK